MGNTIGLKQLAQKKYVLLEGIPADLVASIGELEDTFDACIYGPSNNGKSSFMAIFLIALIESMKCRCEYIAFEEGHGKTVQDTMIKRYNMLERLGNAILISDHYTYEELDRKLGMRKSAKIWVFDSIQASGLTKDQILDLKRKYLNSRKRKIFLFVSWSQGKKPLGSIACAIEYLSNIKLRVQDLIVFPKSRYGGGMPFVIHEETARMRLGDKEYYKLSKRKPPAKEKKKKEPASKPSPETNNNQL